MEAMKVKNVLIPIVDRLIAHVADVAGAKGSGDPAGGGLISPRLVDHSSANLKVRLRWGAFAEDGGSGMPWCMSSERRWR